MVELDLDEEGVQIPNLRAQKVGQGDGDRDERVGVTERRVGVLQRGIKFFTFRTAFILSICLMQKIALKEYRTNRIAANFV